MKIYIALFLLLNISIAYGLRCYSCAFADPKSCTSSITCPALLDRCFSLSTGDKVTKGCQNSLACVSPIDCCEGNLCNSAFSSRAPSLLLLLLSSSALSFLM